MSTKNPPKPPRVTVRKDTRDDYSVHLDEEARDRLGKEGGSRRHKVREGAWSRLFGALGVK